MTELHNRGSLASFDCESFDNFESYLLGKDDRVALKGEHACGPLDLIHSDVCGPYPLIPKVVSSTSLPSLMIIHDLGT